MKGKRIVPGLVAGFVTTIGCWASAQFIGVVIPGEVGAAGSGLLAVLISILTPDTLEADE
jgi:hypothetical protein